MNGKTTYILKTCAGFEVGTMEAVFGKSGAFSNSGGVRRRANLRIRAGIAETLEEAMSMAEGLRRSGAAAHGLTEKSVAAQKTPKMSRNTRNSERVSFTLRELPKKRTRAGFSRERSEKC